MAFGLSVLGLVVVALVFLFFLFTEYLDWHGRMEVIEQIHPKLWKAMNDRPFRIVVLMLILGLLIEGTREQLKGLNALETEPFLVHVAIPSDDSGAKDAEIARLERENERLRKQFRPLQQQQTPTQEPRQQVDHPIITVAATHVAIDELKHSIYVRVALHNSSQFATSATVGWAFFWRGNPVQPSQPSRVLGFPPGNDQTELSADVTLSPEDYAGFTANRGKLTIRVTAEYPDRDGRTLYVMDGEADAKSDRLNITNSDWHHRNSSIR